MCTLPIDPLGLRNSRAQSETIKANAALGTKYHSVVLKGS